jgi:methionyl-tRNA formyltransferase
MWLGPGIDSGPIIATEQTGLTGDEVLEELHWKVMEHAHDLYSRAIRAIQRGVDSVPRIAQDSIVKGRTFYTIEWNGRAMLRAALNFKRHYAPEYFEGEEFKSASSSLKLFPLET